MQSSKVNDDRLGRSGCTLIGGDVSVVQRCERLAARTATSKMQLLVSSTVKKKSGARRLRALTEREHW
jgi:hypothetical protein